MLRIKQQLAAVGTEALRGIRPSKPRKQTQHGRVNEADGKIARRRRVLCHPARDEAGSLHKIYPAPSVHR